MDLGSGISMDSLSYDTDDNTVNKLKLSREETDIIQKRFRRIIFRVQPANTAP